MIKNKPNRKEYFFVRNELLNSVIYSICIIAAFTPAILAVLFAPIDPDSGCYLAIIERINDGYVPYRDFSFFYTPFVFYIGFVIKKIFSIGISYEAFLILHFVFQTLAAVFVYKLTKLFTNRKDFGFFAAILFIILSHWNGGNAFLLETPSIFFGLWAIYFITRYPKNTLFIFFSGILAALAFLCKQYGFGFLLLNALVLFQYTKRLKHLTVLFFGFSIPIVICFLIWGSNFLPVLYGGGYSGEMVFFDRIKMLFNRLIFLHLFAPVLLIIWLNSFSILKNKSPKGIQIVMLIFGILGFMLQFLFQPFSHYYLFVIPFVCILIFTVYTYSYRFHSIFKLFIILTFTLSLIATYQFKVNKIYIQKSNIKSDQKSIAKALIKQIPSGNTLYISNVNLIEQYYLTNLLPPNFRTLGYTFGVALSPQMHDKQIQDANYILKFKSAEKEYDIYTNLKYNQLNNRKQISINNNVFLYH